MSILVQVFEMLNLRVSSKVVLGIYSMHVVAVTESNGGPNPKPFREAIGETITR